MDFYWSTVDAEMPERCPVEKPTIPEPEDVPAVSDRVDEESMICDTDSFSSYLYGRLGLEETIDEGVQKSFFP